MDRTLASRAYSIVLFFAAMIALAAMLTAAPPANAEVTYEGSFGSPGSGAGQFQNPRGIAVNDSTGDVYVVDRGNYRVEEFNENGGFIRAWGFDVVASGTDNQPNANEVQRVTTAGSSGTFRLSFEGESTAPIPYNATALEVQTALDSLSTVNSGGGGVIVTGSDGGPYSVTFAVGPVSGRNVEPLGVDSSGLGFAAGMELSCSWRSNFAQPSTVDYQWLANGSPIAGATSSTYTTTAGDAGKVVQCQVTGNFGATGKAVGVGKAYRIVSPAPATVPPGFNQNFLFPQALTSLPVKGSGGQIKCFAGSWTNSPESFTYSLLGNGKVIGGPVTTTETSTTFNVSEEDLQEPTAFQCSIKATNGGGSSVFDSQTTSSSPAPSPEPFTPIVSIQSKPSPEVVSTTEGGAVFEVCEANPPSTDVCKAGVSGAGMGQFSSAQGIAVDNSPGGNGDVWVTDERNFRIEKFTSTGTPILTIGKEVNKTTGEDICTAAEVSSGNLCGAGLVNPMMTGAGFGGWPVSYAQHHGNNLSVDDEGNLYVGDPRAWEEFNQTGPNTSRQHSRIAKFDSSGHYLSEVYVPALLPSYTDYAYPISTVVDSQHRVFSSLFPDSDSGIVKFMPSEFTPEGTYKNYAERTAFDETGTPTELALDPTSNIIWTIDFNNTFSLEHNGPERCHETGPQREVLMAFDAEGHRYECAAPSGTGTIPGACWLSCEAEGTGLAVSPSSRGYVAIKSLDTIKYYKLPHQEAPEVVGESVHNITTETAKLGAEISPGFDATSYEFEYGAEDCATSTCTVVPGGTVYGSPVQSGQVALEGLTPNTRYHYRVVAENSKGTQTGPDHTFVTYPFVDLRHDSCPNSLARKQTGTAGLLDCRAYELATAEFTGGYDVVSDLVPGEHPLSGYPHADGKLLYSIDNGGIPGTGEPTNRGLDPYVATRGTEGWSTRYVGIPAGDRYAKGSFSSTLLEADQNLGTFAFGGAEICQPCFEDGSSGIPLRMPDGALVQGMQGSKAQAEAEPEGYVAKYLSADGSHLVFGSSSQFEPAGNSNGDVTIYERNLLTGSTEVVSTRSDGQTMSGAEVGELDVSSDGSRVVVGEELSSDAAGNAYWHPYMHFAGSSHSLDLAPGASKGVLFDGMTADGSKVFFTTTDQLLPEDEDENADIYEAEVGPDHALHLRLVSVSSSGASNDESCTPEGLPNTWNAPVGNGECGALAFGGGAGVASESGTFFFLSPEKLDGSQGIFNQPNLYVLRPGDSSPQFVATIDTSEGKPGPGHWLNPLETTNFTSSNLSAPQRLAVDQSTGDLYAIEQGSSEVARFSPSGAPHDFEGSSTNKIPATISATSGMNGVAVDNSSGPMAGDLYVTHSPNEIDVFSTTTGKKVGALNGSTTIFGSFGEVCGVAVDHSNGDVYIADPGIPGIWRFHPNGPPGAEVDPSDYSVSLLVDFSMTPCSLVAENETVYVSARSGGPTRKYSAEQFKSPYAFASGEVFSPEGGTLSIDPAADEIYIDTGSEIQVLSAAGEEIMSLTEGSLSGSLGVAPDGTNHYVYASNGSHIVKYGYEPSPWHPVSNKAVLDAAERPESRQYGDFEVTPDGRYAAFGTAMPLKTGYDNAGYSEVYRYDVEEGTLSCTSCLPSEGAPTSDSALPRHGLGLTDDGRVFFNTANQLVLRDTNEKLDGYEWEEGTPQLISTGTSIFSSGLLGVTSDGVDAFFFTRDQLVAKDHNGETMKIYDAREKGGFFELPESPPCAASDECHGAGSQAAPPPQIGTFKGSSGQFTAPVRKCRQGYVRRHRKCVKKHRKHVHHRKHRRGGRAHGRGGR